MALWDDGTGVSNVLDHNTNPIGFGTVAGEHVMPQSINSTTGSQVIFPSDPRITYFDYQGVPDEMAMGIDPTIVTAPAAFTTANDYIAAVSYVAPANVQAFQFLLGMTSNGANTYTCKIFADLAGAPDTTTQIGGTAYDEAFRTQTSTYPSNLPLVGFHFYLNNIATGNVGYTPGMTQAPVSLATGVKYWFVVQIVTPVSGGSVAVTGTTSTGWGRYQYKPAAGSWTSLPNFKPAYAVITSGWKISTTVLPAYGGITRQLANYNYSLKTGMADLTQAMINSGAYPLGAYGNPISPSANGGAIPNVATLSSLGPSFSLSVNSNYVSILDDVLENLNYDSPGLDDRTSAVVLPSNPTLQSIITRKQLRVMVDGAWVGYLTGGNFGNAQFPSPWIPTYTTYRLEEKITGLTPGNHTITVQLAYFKYICDVATGGLGGGSPTFTEVAGTPDQFRFEGVRIAPQTNFDNLAILPSSQIVTMTTDSTGFAQGALKSLAGQTLICIVGAYVINPTATSQVVCGIDIITLQNGAASTTYSVRVTALVSPSNALLS